LFAQELGTAEPVSVVKLDRALATLRAGVDPSRALAAAAAPAMPKPIVSAPVASGKTAPLKNLGALDQLFKR
jgi:ATP-dependent helicase HrpA